MSGVPHEQQKGTPCHKRSTNDFETILSTISNIESGFNHSSTLRDCIDDSENTMSQNLTPFFSHALNSTADVSHILSCCCNLKPPLPIKPDMSPQETKCVTSTYKLCQR